MKTNRLTVTGDRCAQTFTKAVSSLCSDISIQIMDVVVIMKQPEYESSTRSDKFVGMLFRGGGCVERRGC